MLRRFKPVIGFLAAMGAASVLTTPAEAVGVYFGTPGVSAYFGGASDADQGPCDYYSPPWGYPADYCNYQVWNEPVYYGGTWYGGPIYYRPFGGQNWFWLNGGWRRHEWRGAPPPRIDWARNRFWSGARQFGYAQRWAFSNLWERRDFDRRGGFRGPRYDSPNYGGREYGGRNFTGPDYGGREYGGRNFGGREFEQRDRGARPGPGQMGGRGPRDGNRGGRGTER